MAAHNMIDWVPCHANKKMLTDTMRNRFGFRNGYIGSDNTNVEGELDSMTSSARESARGHCWVASFPAPLLLRGGVTEATAILSELSVQRPAARCFC